MRHRNNKIIFGILAAVLLLGVTTFLFLKPNNRHEADDLIARIVASEEFMESQRKPLKNLALTLTADSEPANIMPEMFTEDFSGNSVSGNGETTPLPITQGHITQWQTNGKQIKYPHGKGWKPFGQLFTGEEDYDFIKAYMIRGEFLDDNTFRADIGVQGRARAGEGRPWRAFRSKNTVTWITSNAPRISEWKIKSFELIESPLRIFEDVTAKAIPETKFRAEVEQSMHEEYFIAGFLGKPVSLYRSQKHLAKYLNRDALTLHPGLAVVDYDGDGWDDLYLTVRQGRNILLKNLRNGTFRDATVETRLAVPGLSNAALFADFDNDGDPDLFLGRILKPSLYFRNDGGVFTECSESRFNVPLPQFANSVSAVDYNQDGLLDIYVCTYGLFGSSNQEVLDKNRPFISNEAYRTYASRLPKAHRYLNMVGPPNMLFVNRGDRGFELAPENASLQFYNNSFQSSWSDFDDDGDEDLYIANDFARDLLIRNDGKNAQGTVQFTKVTDSIGHRTMNGFGMGVDWGDYDRDGKEDLYISNMFSKAGLRITQQVPGLDPRFHEFAEGNRLYRYDGKAFQLTSYPAKNGHPVHQAGWSWGGRLFDANNDGWLDIYAANGYYTAPPQLSNEADG